MLRSSLLGLVVCAACGGQVATVGDGGVDSSVPKDGAADTAPSTDCNALRAQIDTLTDQAKTCFPQANTPQCTNVAHGLCCDISITGTSAPDLDKAIAQYKTACGPVACPAVLCPTAPSKICPPVPNGPSKCP